MKSPLKSLIVGLGLVVGVSSSALARDPGQGPRGERPERGEREERGDRGPRGDREDREDRDERDEREDRGDRGPRGDSNDRNDRNVQNDRNDRTDRGVQNDRNDRNDRNRPDWEDVDGPRGTPDRPGRNPEPSFDRRFPGAIVTPPAAHWEHNARRGRGAIFVTNHHDGPVHVFVDGERLGRLRRGEAASFDGIRVGSHVVSFREPRGVEIMRENVFIERHRVVSLAVTQPWGTVVVRNRTPHRVRVTVAGRDLGWIAPGEIERVRGLPRGLHTLEWSAGRRGRIDGDRANVRVIAGQNTPFDIVLRTGSLDVRNPYAFPVDVVVDGKLMTRLGAFGSVRLAAVEAGAATIRFEHRGRIIANETVVVIPERTAIFAPRVAVAPPVVARRF